MDKKNKKKEKRSKGKKESEPGMEKRDLGKSKNSELTFGLDMNYSNDIPLSMDDLCD